MIHAVGSGAITVVDVSQLSHSSVADAREGDPLCMTDVRVHILPHGASFDLNTLKASPPEA